MIRTGTYIYIRFPERTKEKNTPPFLKPINGCSLQHSKDTCSPTTKNQIEDYITGGNLLELKTFYIMFYL